MGHKKEILRGVSWIGILSFATKTVGFVEAIILARILLPSQFGAYGVALLALGLLEVITQSGVNIVLIQQESIDKFISSAWILSIVRGILIMFVLLLAAPLISVYFHSAESLNLLYMISFVPLLRGFINPSVVKFQKELKFGKDFWFRFIILVVDTIVSVMVTFVTRNPIGIVVGLLAGVITELFLSFILISPRPKLRLENKIIKFILHQGKWITASSIFDYLFYNADNIAVGRILGATSLGIYQLAYSIAAVPLTEVGKVFVHVTAPFLLKFSDDSIRLKRAFLGIVVSIALITLPFAFIFALVPQISVMILGTRWAAVATIIPILGVLGFVKSVSLSSSALFISLKKQKYTSIITLVNILGLIVSIVPLIMSHGVFGAGLSALFGSVCAIPFIIYYVAKTFRELEARKI